MAKKIYRRNSARKSKKNSSNIPLKPVHPWRLCPIGMYFRRAHIQSDYVTKEGKIVPSHMIRGHCVTNPSGFDQIYPDEIHEIAEEQFSKLRNNLPASEKSKYNGDQYDQMILGWTQYWNQVLNPIEKLDPILIKALIFSESSFNANSKNRVPDSKEYARGLMQITDSAIKIIGDENGEIKDHYVNICLNESFDPNMNICAGIRWLFHKKNLATATLKREASWIEAVANFKSDLKRYLSKKPRKTGVTDKFIEIYNRFKLK